MGRLSEGDELFVEFELIRIGRQITRIRSDSNFQKCLQVGMRMTTFDNFPDEDGGQIMASKFELIRINFFIWNHIQFINR